MFYSPTRYPSFQVTIEELSDKVLLKIFRYFLDASPRHWIKLVHICHKWRRIVFEAQQPLSLRLFCTQRTPVLETVDCWPTLPIILEYGGPLAHRPPTPEDEDNIVAALNRSGRVTSITLTVTGSLMKKLYKLKGPFLELEDLHLSRDSTVPLILPNTFRWGPRLRRLHSTGIAFPALLKLLSSSNLVDLRLHDVPNISYFSPKALTKALSGMSQLRSFSLHFPSTATCRDQSPSTEKRLVLPALTRLDFRGFTRYLEGLVDTIYAPQLEDIEITLFYDSAFHPPKLRELINRMEMRQSHSRAHILFSEDFISLSLMQPGAPTCLRLQLLCKSLFVQHRSTARICVEFSPFLLNVRDLRISVARPDIRETAHLELWSEILYPFTGVTRLHLDPDCLTNAMRVLLSSERKHQNVVPVLLPILRKLYIPQAAHQSHVPLAESVVSFITSRRRSGHLVEVYEQSCEIFRTGTCLV